MPARAITRPFSYNKFYISKEHNSYEKKRESAKNTELMYGRTHGLTQRQIAGIFMYPTMRYAEDCYTLFQKAIQFIGYYGAFTLVLRVLIVFRKGDQT